VLSTHPLFGSLFRPNPVSQPQPAAQQPAQQVTAVQPPPQQQVQQLQPPQQVQQPQVAVASRRQGGEQVTQPQHGSGSQQQQQQQQQEQQEEEGQVDESEGEGLTPIEVPATRFESVVFKLFQVSQSVLLVVS
jgi:hypothetical protein